MRSAEVVRPLAGQHEDMRPARYRRRGRASPSRARRTRAAVPSRRAAPCRAARQPSHAANAESSSSVTCVGSNHAPAPSIAASADPGDDTGAPAPGAARRDADRLRAARVLGQPLGQVAWTRARRRRPRNLRSASGSADSQCLVQPVAQHPELERVEDAVHGVSVPLLHAQVAGLHLDGNVAHQLGQLAVAHHVAEMRAQRIAGLARDLVHPIDEVAEAAELADPLGRGLLPHPGDVGQVVAGVAADRREVGVLARRQAVALAHRGRGHPAEFGHSAPGIQHGDRIGHQLEGVAVTADDQDVEAGRFGLRRQRRDDVVGFVALGGDDRDPQCVEHLADQLHLPLEVGRRLEPTGLVLGVGLPSGTSDVTRRTSPRDASAARLSAC